MHYIKVLIWLLFMSFRKRYLSLKYYDLLNAEYYIYFKYDDGYIERRQYKVIANQSNDNFKDVWLVVTDMGSRLHCTRGFYIRKCMFSKFSIDMGSRG